MKREVVEVAARTDGRTVLARLGIDSTATVVLNGATDEDPRNSYRDLGRSIDAIVAALTPGPDVAFVSGGTDAGIFAILGRAVSARGFAGPLIGVVPSGRVRVPELDLDSPRAHAPEPHHTHLVVVEGDGWGDETPVMLDLVDALSERGPVIVVIAGGGAVTETELQGHDAAGRTVLLVGRRPNKGAAPQTDSHYWISSGDSQSAVDVVRRVLNR